MTMEIPLPHTTPPITKEQVMAFAAVSGDANPIHISDEVARAAGLPGSILHGMMVAGRFEMFLERIEGHMIAELRVRFVRPVPVGSAITISARRIGSSGELPHLRLIASIGPGMLVAIGDAILKPVS